MSMVSAIDPFVAPIEGGVDILVVAGEHSGDQHAARMVRKLLAGNPSLRICAIGGPELEKAGAQLLFNLTEFSVVGFVEVLKHVKEFNALMLHSVNWVAKYRPSCVCFVDYPGFNLRLAARLADAGISRKAGGNVSLFYYISPQIWAWKAGRRFKMARLLDAMAVIFPFEVDSYSDTDLRACFVGHPFVFKGRESGLRYDSNGPLLILPGSRVQAVSRIFPVMLCAFAELLKTRPQERAVVLYPDTRIKELLEKILARHALGSRVELRAAEQGAAAKACLISSGTMSLNCALAGIPGCICYRAHPLTYYMGKMFIKVPYLGIANLLLPDEPPYREFIQGEARAGVLAADLLDAMDNPTRAAASAAAAEKLRSALSENNARDLCQWLVEVAHLA